MKKIIFISLLFSSKALFVQNTFSHNQVDKVVQLESKLNQQEKILKKIKK
jgi:hypothetical protein